MGYAMTESVLRTASLQSEPGRERINGKAFPSSDCGLRHFESLDTAYLGCRCVFLV
jgi:hypothetical protein